MSPRSGIATGLAFERGSYGPFSPDLKRRIGQLENNGLAVETKHGHMFEMRVGPTYADAVAKVRDRMEPYREAVERTVDLMARMDTRSAEVAATVHYVAAESLKDAGVVPQLAAVLERVEAWKPGRFKRDDVVDAAALLCMRGWSRIAVDEETSALVEDRLSG